ncbi:MAG: hypothetical protein ACTS3F_12635 [Phycisphaerales bacterium]
MSFDLLPDLLWLASTAREGAGAGWDLGDENVETLIKLGFVVVVIGIFGIVGALKTMARERSRREIAAYIAEGSMTPEQGQSLISAKFKGSC